MKVLLIDAGRGSSPATVEVWRSKLQLADTDELALLSWHIPRGPLPLSAHLVFGPTLRLTRVEPVRANVTPAGAPSTAPAFTASGPVDARSLRRLPRTHPRRLSAAARRRLVPVIDRVSEHRFSPLRQVRSGGLIGRGLRRMVGVRTDGVATDFALAVARSTNARELAAWADVVVPYDTRSRKAAWVLSRLVPGPLMPLDVNTALRMTAPLR